MNQEKTALDIIREQFKEELHNINICEWCTKIYPKGICTYYRLVVFDTEHIICDDCYERLKKW